MPEDYSKEFKKLKKIPLDIKQLIFSDEIGLILAKICFSNNIKEEEKMKKIGYQVGNTLIGLLPPEKLIDALKKEAGLSPITAVKIASEIDHNVFSMVKKSLNTLYKKRGVSVKKPVADKKSSVPESSLDKSYEKRPIDKKSPVKENPPKKKPDIYREPIE